MHTPGVPQIARERPRGGGQPPLSQAAWEPDRADDGARAHVLPGGRGPLRQPDTRPAGGGAAVHPAAATPRLAGGEPPGGGVSTARRRYKTIPRHATPRHAPHPALDTVGHLWEYLLF